MPNPGVLKGLPKPTQLRVGICSHHYRMMLYQLQILYHLKQNWTTFDEINRKKISACDYLDLDKEELLPASRSTDDGGDDDDINTMTHVHNRLERVT